METGRALSHQVYELVAGNEHYVGWGRMEPWRRLPASVAAWASRTAAKLDWRWVPSCAMDKAGARALAVARREQIKSWGGTLIVATVRGTRRPVACRTARGEVVRFTSVREAAREMGVWQNSISQWLHSGCLDSEGNSWFDDCGAPTVNICQPRVIFL